MAIRLRMVNNQWIALCAAKTVHQKRDVYLDDSQHHALTTKFAIDWDDEDFHSADWADPILSVLMDKEERSMKSGQIIINEKT